MRGRIALRKVNFRIGKYVGYGMEVRKMMNPTVDLNSKIGYNTAVSSQQSAVSSQQSAVVAILF